MFLHDLQEWTDNNLTHLMGAITREELTRACADAFPAEVHHDQSEELGPLDIAGDEQEEFLGMQMGDAKEQEQEFMDQLKLECFPQFEDDENENGWLDS